MSPRRVITGETPEGQAVFTHVEEIDPLHVGKARRHIVWRYDEIPDLPYHHPGAFALPDGLPEGHGALQVETWILPPKFPDDENTHELNTRMHSTDTIDVIFVIDGEICLIEGDGTEVTLRQGDAVLQHGTKHNWRNRSDRPCVLGQVFVGTERVGGD